MSELTLCPFDELVDGGVRRFEIEGRELAVVRIGDDVYALEDRCSHRDVPLSDGDVDTDERTLECSLHGAAFDLVTGKPECPPATQPVPVFELRVANGDVLVVLS